MLGEGGWSVSLLCFCFHRLHQKDWPSFVLPILKIYSLLHDESKRFSCFVHRGKLMTSRENLRCFALILQLVFATHDCSIRRNVTIRLLMHRNALFEAVHIMFSCFISLFIYYPFIPSLSIMSIVDCKTNNESTCLLLGTFY